MEKTYYEIIKFTSRGNICRTTMDYVQGDLLYDLVKRDTYISKEEVFYWFSSLIEQLVQYHKFSKNRCYRYLYPLSICITRDNELYLLDLEATNNDFVLKNIQTRSMRQHFIKPKRSSSYECKISQDLYGLGKTMQFVLAHCTVMPDLTRSEENKLHSIIDKCIGEEPKKQYQDFSQIQKETKFLKTNSKQGAPLTSYKKIAVLAGLTGVIIMGGMTAKALTSGGVDISGDGLSEINGIEASEEIGKDLFEAEGESNSIDDENNGHYGEEARGDAESKDNENNEQGDENKDENESDKDDAYGERASNGMNGSVDLNEAIKEMEDEIAELAYFLHENSSISNRMMISRGIEMELNLLRALALAYEREGFYKDAIMAYARLVEIEVKDENKEEAFIRKMKIEAELGLFEQALETGRIGLEQIDDSLSIVRTYFEIMIECGIYDADEVIGEYERICKDNPKAKTDGYLLKLISSLD